MRRTTQVAHTTRREFLALFGVTGAIAASGCTWLLPENVDVPDASIGQHFDGQFMELRYIEGEELSVETVDELRVHHDGKVEEWHVGNGEGGEDSTSFTESDVLTNNDPIVTISELRTGDIVELEWVSPEGPSASLGEFEAVSV